MMTSSPNRKRRATRLLSTIALSTLLAGVMVAFTPTAATAAPSNVVVNSGFETGSLSNWSTWSNGNGDADYVEASGSRFGTYHGTHYSASAYQVYTYQLVTGLPNGTYTVSAQVRSSGGQNSANLTVKSYGGSALTDAVPAGPFTGWRPVAIADISVTSGQLEVGMWSDGKAGNWLYFDSVRIERIAPVASEATPGTNMVTNSGFESGTSSWGLSGAASVVSNNANSGSNSLALGANSGFAYQNITSGFTVGATYVLTAFGKTNDQGSVALVGVQARNSSNAILYDAKIPFFAASYSKNSTTLVIPSGTTYLQVYAFKEDGSKTGTVHIDGISLYASTGTQYFVDATSGSNSAAGTSQASAWRTLDRVATATLVPGDSVLLKGGQTHSGGLDIASTSSGSMNYPITISSYGSGRATITSTSQDGIYLQDTGGFHIYNLDITGPGSSTAVYNGIKATNSSATVQRGLIGIDNVTESGYYLGIQINGDRGRGFGPVNLMNSTTHDNFREGTNVFGYGSGGRNAGEWYTQGLFDHVYVGYLTSYNNFEWSGILVANANEAVIEHSLAYNIGSAALAAEGPVGIWTIGCERCTVQFNTAHHVYSSADKLDGDGFDISNNNTNVLYQYNYAYSNEGPGLLIDNYNVASPTTNKITMRYNVSQGNCTDNLFCGELYIYGEVGNPNVYNNTLRATQSGASAVRVAGEYGSSSSHPGTTNGMIRNNILSVSSGVELVHLTATNDGGYAWGDAGDLVFQGNLYWSNGSAFTIYDKATTYASLSTWRAVGREKVGATSVGIQGDPSLVAPLTLGNADNLKIGSSSAARDAGLGLSALFGTTVGVRDYFGGSLPANSVFDIGAHEYQ